MDMAVPVFVVVLEGSLGNRWTSIDVDVVLAEGEGVALGTAVPPLIRALVQRF